MERMRIATRTKVRWGKIIESGNTARFRVAAFKSFNGVIILKIDTYMYLDKKQKLSTYRVINRTRKQQLQMKSNQGNITYPIHTIDCIQRAYRICTAYLTAKIQDNRKTYRGCVPCNKNNIMSSSKAKSIIEKSPFKENFNIQQKELWDIYSCTEPKSLAFALQEANKEQADPLFVKIGPTKNENGKKIKRCGNCKQWAPSGGKIYPKV